MSEAKDDAGAFELKAGQAITWTSTSDYRLIKRPDWMSGFPARFEIILQRASRCVETGDIVWEDVPTIET